MKFRYQARNKSGELQVGFVDAANREAAFNILSSYDLYVLALTSAEEKHWYEFLVKPFRRVKNIDLMAFTRQFATLLEAKVPLSDSLKNLFRQTSSPILKEAVYELYSDIDSGLSFSQALERQRNIFSDFYINMVKSAEVTGRVDEVMGFLADYLEKEAHLLSKIKNALIYPVTVIVLFMVVVFLMLTVVLPQVQPIFEESNIELPIFTKVMLATGAFLNNWWFVVIPALFSVIIVLINYSRSVEGKALFDDLSIRIPVLGNLFRKIYVARFSESFGVLIKGGVPVVQAIEISGHTIDNYAYQEVLHGIAEAVKRGELLSHAIEKEEKFFPPLVSQMISIGESTGKLDDLLGRISLFYSRQVDDLVSNLVELIQPALILGIGVLAGLLFASILMPLYNLVNTF